MTPLFYVRDEDDEFLTRLFGGEMFFADMGDPYYDMFAVRLETKPNGEEASHMTTTLVKMATAKGCHGAVGWRRGYSAAGYDLAVVGIKA
jgi:uncharacterized protein YcnI